MLAQLPLRGTLLNTATVLAGSLLGLWLGGMLSPKLQVIALSAIGLITMALGLKMVFETKSLMIVAGAVVAGGLIGSAIGIDVGLEWVAEEFRRVLGGGGRFNEGLVTSIVLFSIGPMTLLGCIQDGLEKKIDLLAIKSILDGVAAIFLAGALGSGVVASAFLVLIIQSIFTLSARALKPLAAQPKLMRETGAAGGVILMAIGLGLLELKKIPSAVFFPALVLAPLAAHFFLKEPVENPQVP